MKLTSVLLIVAVILTVVAPAWAFDTGWQKPLAVKEQELEANILVRHNILGLYPSMVEIPPEGSAMDITTAMPFSDAVHAVAWTSHYLAGASYRYAWLRDNGAPPDRVEQARRRADELFEAVYRCQRVTGKRGLLVRGYFIGTGPTFDERRMASHKDDWHQGHVDGYDLRFCAAPSHHIYSAAAMGMGHYYDLAAEGDQKARAREAIDALVSYWVDNDYKIAGYDENSRPPFSILGYTDGKTLNTRVMMAISAAKIAHHATGKEKFRDAYEDLLTRYGVRGLKTFRGGEGYDDAHHVFAHLDLLDRIEKDPKLRAAYGVVADGMWQHYTEEGHSHFTYIYYHLRPDAEGKDKALRAAHHTLGTWPTDMTIQPIMSSLNPEIKPPYPVYATGWDNEFIWKGSLLRPDSHHSRSASDIDVCPQPPHVAMVVDSAGHLYLTHDRGRTSAGWKYINGDLPTPVRAAAFGERAHTIAVACDDGFYLSRTAGAEAWQRLPLEFAGEPKDVKFDPRNPGVIYAMSDQSIYEGIDYGPEMTGRAWKDYGGGLPAGLTYRFHVATGADDQPTHLYAVSGADVYASVTTDPGNWTRSVLGLGRYGQAKRWLAIDPSDPRHALFGVRFGGFGGLPQRTVLQETRDGGLTWTGTQPELTRAFYDEQLPAVLARYPAHDFSELHIAGPPFDELLAVTSQAVVMAGSADPDSWAPVMAGLDIPLVRRLFVPRDGDRIYASTPAGIYHLKAGDKLWQPSHLVMQWRRHERRELGGAAFITAYWRALYYGLLDPAVTTMDYDQASRRGWRN